MKFLLLLVILGAVAYLAPAPLGHAEQAIEITTDRERVWTVLADVSSARLWDPGMKEMKITSERKSGPGTVRHAAGPLVKTTESVREWIAYNKISFDVIHDPKVTKFETSTIAIEPGERGGTRVRWALDYRMTGGTSDISRTSSSSEASTGEGFPRACTTSSATPRRGRRLRLSRCNIEAARFAAISP